MSAGLIVAGVVVLAVLVAAYCVFGRKANKRIDRIIGGGK